MPIGIVITNGMPGGGTVFHLALIHQKYTNVSEFKVMPIETRRMKEKSVPSRDIRERDPIRVMREVTETLYFGQTLEWSETDAFGRPVAIIQQYKKLRDIYPTRSLDGEMHILLPGIMSRNRKVLWMIDIWPDLEIPYRLQNDTHPDIAVNAWVILHNLPNQTLKYELHSFHNLAEEYQHVVTQARWNKGILGNLDPMYDPVANDEPRPELASPLSDTLTGMRGIVVSHKIILSSEPKHRDLCFHTCVVNEDSKLPPVGTLVRFNAEKLSFLHIYAVKNVQELRNERRMQVTPDEKIKVPIRWQEHLPGFYFCASLSCFVDDPENVLEAWLLSSYSKSNLQVAICAGEPSERGVARYSVAEITDAKLSKIGKELKLADEQAVVISGEGKLHVPRLPRTVVKLAGMFLEMGLTPGTVVRIDAVLERRWRVTKVEIDTKTPKVESETVDEEIRFKVAEARGSNDLPHLYRCPLFGLIQPPKLHRIRKFPEQAKLRNVWVKLNDNHPGDILPPAAKFVVCEKKKKSDNGRVSPLDTLQSLQEHPDWQYNAGFLVRQLIEDHPRTCADCRPDSFSNRCYFPELLAKALVLKPEISDALEDSELLTFIALRQLSN